MIRPLRVTPVLLGPVLLGPVLLVALVGCGDDGPSFACVPDEAAWQSEVAPLVAQHCGSCHGEEPSFGAPVSLVDYVSVLDNGVTGRLNDHIVERLMTHTMPPVGAPRPPQDVLEAITEWASCGEQTPDAAGGLTVSVPPVRSPETAPEGMPFFDMTAPDFPVGPTVLDHYQCWTFEVPLTEPSLIKRFEILIDEARVLHHAVLLRDTDGTAPDEPFTCFSMPAGSDYLYAWAPGQDAIEFDEGGLRVDPGERFVLQIHYNNGPGIEDVQDSSGVRMYHGPLGGTEYGMIAVGPIDFSVPARSTQDVTGTCTFSEDATVFAGLPHMHEIGAGFQQDIVRVDGSRETLVELSGWSFETQLFYEMPTTLAPGDQLITTCRFDNPTDSEVSVGTGTQDEMCFNFMYVTPPPTARFCDGGGPPTGPPELEYVPGECAPTPGLAATEVADGKMLLGPPPALTGGTPGDGLYRMAGIDIYLESLETPAGTIDSEAAYTRSRGQLELAGGRLTVDAVMQFAAVHVGGFTFEDDNDIAFGGAVGEVVDGHLTLAQDCPSGSPSTFDLDFEASGADITLGFQSAGPSGTTWIRQRWVLDE